MILGLSVAAAVVILDQLSKYWIKAHVLADAPVIALTSFFNLVTAWNTGVSFSMFNDGGWFGIVAFGFGAGNCYVAVELAAPGG